MARVKLMEAAGVGMAVRYKHPKRLARAFRKVKKLLKKAQAK